MNPPLDPSVSPRLRSYGERIVAEADTAADLVYGTGVIRICDWLDEQREQDHDPTR